MEKRENSLKKLLDGLEKNELVEIILELSKISARNSEFLNIYLRSSDELDIEQIISNAKASIYRFIYGSPKTGRNCLKLREAKKVISDNSKILKEHPIYIADLKLNYVETCNDFTNDFGDISEQFYDSAIRAFVDFARFIRKNPTLYNSFKERLDRLYINSKGIGWG